MLVVADKDALRVGRKRRLAGAGKAEEDCRLAGLGILVHRRVHRKDVVLLDRKVVHRREDRLLDLARVAGAEDQDLMLLEVDEDAGLGVRAIDRRIALAARSCKDREVRRAIRCKLFIGRTHEELLREECLACQLADDLELAGVCPVRASIGMDHIEVTLCKVGADLLLDVLVAFDAHRHIHGAPGNLVMHIRRIDNEAVLRRASRILAGVDCECAGRGQLALALLQGLFYKHGRSGVDQHLALMRCNASVCKLFFDHDTSS